MKFQHIVKENKTMMYSAGIAIIAVLVILVMVRQEVDRFIFIMPVFAGWILFNILMLPDEEERMESEPTKDHKLKKKSHS